MKKYNNGLIDQTSSREAWNGEAAKTTTTLPQEIPLFR
jgi:hypothetical protein